MVHVVNAPRLPNAVADPKIDMNQSNNANIKNSNSCSAIQRSVRQFRWCTTLPPDD